MKVNIKIDADFFEKMTLEQARALEKHGGWPHDPHQAAAVITEEHGKMIKALNDAVAASDVTPEHIAEVKKYAMRVAANAMTFHDSLCVMAPE